LYYTTDDFRREVAKEERREALQSLTPEDLREFLQSLSPKDLQIAGLQKTGQTKRPTPKGKPRRKR
jgi:hypothetical protein